MTDPTWPWADSPQSSDWPWLRNVSTSQTPAKGEDYQTAGSIHLLNDTIKPIALKDQQPSLN
jgi:hypothetical protein